MQRERYTLHSKRGKERERYTVRGEKRKRYAVTEEKIEREM